MKKLILAALAVFALGTFTVRADNGKAVSFEQLPQSAQQFVKKYFGKEKVALVKEERNFLGTEEYDVMFLSNIKVEFDKSGEWKEVDCNHTAVPEGIVPVQIAAKAKELYPQAIILEISRDSREYEVKLSNRMELTFDLKFNLIDIDD